MFATLQSDLIKCIYMLILVILASSCVSNQRLAKSETSNTSGEARQELISCKPFREILVDGKCVKRRGFM